ncbi:MAG: LPS export ABC transporter permease LptG [Rhodospirillales bacterium]|nr:MAG: LPS export ABC transporter permease LptG [Rhodospirillales bacterium]
MTLSGYVARQVLLWLVAIFLGIASMVFLVDSVEQLRRAAGKPDVTLGVVVQLSMLQLPFLLQKTLPFIVLFASMMAFWRLSRSNELVVARAAGVSAWQFLLPAVVLGIFVGGLQATILNPLAAAMLARFEKLDAQYMKRATSSLSISPTGVWLRQGDDASHTVINARRITSDASELLNVTFFNFEQPERFVSRVDGESARLENGYWEIRDAVVSAPDRTSETFGAYRIATDLTLDRIQNSFASPETMSFWDLPGFIDTLTAAGFSGHRHSLYWHTLLAMPLLMAAMVLFAAVFTLRIGTRSSATRTIGAGVICSFFLYFATDIVYAMGLSGSVPAILSAWSPAAIATLLALAMVFHLEDG